MKSKLRIHLYHIIWLSKSSSSPHPQSSCTSHTITAGCQKSSPILWLWVEKIGFITVQQFVTKSKSFRGVPKSSPWLPQIGQVFCPTKQKTLARKNVGSRVQTRKHFLPGKTENLWNKPTRVPRDALIKGPRLSDPGGTIHLNLNPHVSAR